MLDIVVYGHECCFGGHKVLAVAAVSRWCLAMFACSWCEVSVLSYLLCNEEAWLTAPEQHFWRTIELAAHVCFMQA